MNIYLLPFPDYFKSELMETLDIPDSAVLLLSRLLQIGINGNELKNNLGKYFWFFPDYFKSELMETFPDSLGLESRCCLFPDYFKSELMETFRSILLHEHPLTFPITSNRN